MNMIVVKFVLDELGVLLTSYHSNVFSTDTVIHAKVLSVMVVL